MIITTTGFYNTGSSAITNIFQEYGSIAASSDVYEVRILHDPDCISDLYYNLVENPNRLNTSYAIKRFREYVDYNSNKLANHHYEQICKGNFKKISLQYIDDLCGFQYKGKSHLEMKDRGVLCTFFNRIYLKMIRTVFRRGRPKWVKTSLLSNVTQYAGTYDKTRFLEVTKEYVGKLLDYCNADHSKYILVDQLVPPTSVERYLAFVPDECRVFIVDRDPRDLYFTCKYFIRSNVVPCKNVEEFCKWFLWTREQSAVQNDPAVVMRVQFEDLVYDYEKTREKIVSFCGLADVPCENKRGFFKPELSLQNTQVWLRFKNYEREVAYIENALKQYCYDFGKYDLKPDYGKGKMFDC